MNDLEPCYIAFVRKAILVALIFSLLNLGCRNSKPDITRSEQPLSAPNLHGVEFYSRSLSRRVGYNIILPADYNLRIDETFPVLYLLHGGGGTRGEWITNSQLLTYSASTELVIVMPDGGDAYYTNESLHNELRWEDFIADELPLEIAVHYRISTKREASAIGGMSLGGYGSLKIALRHPERFAEVFAMSSATDITRRRFSWHRPMQYWMHYRVFGSYGRPHQHDNDVFELLRTADRVKLRGTHFDMRCGSADPLLDTNRRFLAALKSADVDVDYRESAGAHAWDYWDQALRIGIPEIALKLSPPAQINISSTK